MPAPTKPSTSTWYNSWWAHLITALVTGVFAFTSNALLVEPTYVETLQTRISYLEEKNTKLLEEVSELKAQMVRLEYLMKEETTTVSVMCNFFEAFPGLDWIKRVELDESGNPKFTMVCVDSAYSLNYGLSKYRYVGKTDYEIWPKETADQFYQNDTAVYTTGTPFITNESWDVGGKAYSGIVKKYLIIDEMGDLYIGGHISLEESYEEQ